MKKFVAILILPVLFTACKDNSGEKAAMRLANARKAIENGDFNSAKKEIDSIKILYPTAFEARKEGIKIMQQIEEDEQLQTLAYLDSLLAEKQQKFEDIKGNFVFEKNPEYQETGNYFWPTQVVEKNLHRSYLRFQVNEKGALIMTSIYCGQRNIHHVAVKVTAPDGTFAETPASDDIYETTDMGEKIEKADYRMGSDGNVAGFIYLNKDNNIRVEYIGERKYATTMSASDRKAAAGLYELSQILSGIEQIKKDRKEAAIKIEFIKRNREKQ